MHHYVIIYSDVRFVSKFIYIYVLLSVEKFFYRTKHFILIINKSFWISLKYLMSLIVWIVAKVYNFHQIFTFWSTYSSRKSATRSGKYRLQICRVIAHVETVNSLLLFREVVEIDWSVRLAAILVHVGERKLDRVQKLSG